MRLLPIIAARHTLPLLATLLVALAAAPAAQAAESRLVIRGAGFGHGVGMSQYGAYGLALHGSDHRAILGHYYTGTSLGQAPAGKVVRVLLQSPSGTAAFSGATRAGARRVLPERTYRVRRNGASLDLLSASGRRLRTVPAPLRATGRGGLVVKGRAGNGRTNSAYRGALEFRPGTFSGVNVINAVGLESYVQGVVPDESPPSWPIEALKAQAVAARTYAITTSKGGTGWEQYADTRSQVYGGIAAEEPSTNEAVRQTRGQLVTYQGQPVVTYFFSTSGGRTEDVENSFTGSEPRPWLKSVEDPYDDVSPRHRWGPIRLTRAGAERKLGSLVKGALRGIDVVRRGTSPRVVAADVIGTRGRTRVTGATLRARFDLFDTWAFFTMVTVGQEEPPDDGADELPAPAGTEEGGAPAGTEAGGAQAGAAAALRALLKGVHRVRTPDPVIAGRVTPGRRGAVVVVELRTGGEWALAATTKLRRGGRYRVAVPAPGRYRVRARGVIGPSLHVK